MKLNRMKAKRLRRWLWLSRHCTRLQHDTLPFIAGAVALPVVEILGLDELKTTRQQHIFDPDWDSNLLLEGVVCLLAHPAGFDRCR